MEPIELCICEVPHLVLRLNRPYVFVEGADCPKCKALADNAREAYGPDGGAGTGMEVVPRRPLYDDDPEGYRESDRDYVLNNIGVAVALLDRELAGSAALSRS